MRYWDKCIMVEESEMHQKYILITFKKLFLGGLVSPLKSVLTRQEEDGISEIELKIEEKVTEEVKEPPSILYSSDLTRGLPVDF